jgi:hypothetical protein
MMRHIDPHHKKIARCVEWLCTGRQAGHVPYCRQKDMCSVRQENRDKLNG